MNKKNVLSSGKTTSFKRNFWRNSVLCLVLLLSAFWLPQVVFFVPVFLCWHVWLHQSFCVPGYFSKFEKKSFEMQLLRLLVSVVGMVVVPFLVFLALVWHVLRQALVYLGVLKYFDQTRCAVDVLSGEKSSGGNRGCESPNTVTYSDAGDNQQISHTLVNSVWPDLGERDFEWEHYAKLHYLRLMLNKLSKKLPSQCAFAVLIELESLLMDLRGLVADSEQKKYVIDVVRLRSASSRVRQLFKSLKLRVASMQPIINTGESFFSAWRDMLQESGGLYVFVAEQKSLLGSISCQMASMFDLLQLFIKKTPRRTHLLKSEVLCKIVTDVCSWHSSLDLCCVTLEDFEKVKCWVQGLHQASLSMHADNHQLIAGEERREVVSSVSCTILLKDHCSLFQERFRALGEIVTSLNKKEKIDQLMR